MLSMRSYLLGHYRCKDLPRYRDSYLNLCIYSPQHFLCAQARRHVFFPLHYRGESVVTRLHAGLHKLHALDLPKRRWRHLSRHMTILTLLQNIHGDRLRRNTRGTYRIIIRRNRPLLPRKHFRCVGCMTRRTVENHVSSESHWEGA